MFSHYWAHKHTKYVCTHEIRRYIKSASPHIMPTTYGLINYIDTKAKCRHPKILNYIGTLRQVCIKVYSLDIKSVMLVFSTQLCKLLPLSPSLWFNSSPPPPPFPVWISIQWVRGEGYGVLGLRQINTCRKVRLQVNFIRWRHFALPSMSLIYIPTSFPSPLLTPVTGCISWIC